MKVIEIA